MQVNMRRGNVASLCFLLYVHLKSPLAQVVYFFDVQWQIANNVVQLISQLFGSEVVNEQKCVLVRAGAKRSRCAQSMLPTTTNELVSRDSKHNLGKFPKQNYKHIL